MGKVTGRRWCLDGAISSVELAGLTCAMAPMAHGTALGTEPHGRSAIESLTHYYVALARGEHSLTRRRILNPAANIASLIANMALAPHARVARIRSASMQPNNVLVRSKSAHAYRDERSPFPSGN